MQQARSLFVFLHARIRFFILLIFALVLIDRRGRKMTDSDPGRFITLVWLLPNK